MTTIAVIGGGAAGIGAAHRLLHEGHEVLLLEAQARLGGNCTPIDVRDRHGGVTTIDAGVSDFNRVTFRGFTALLDELGLATQPICTDASWATVDGRVQASCRGGAWWFAPGIAGDTVAAEAQRFRERAPEVLANARYRDWTIGRYLDHLGSSAAFRDLVVLPRAGGAFPMPDRDPAAMPLRPLVGFLQVHGIVGAQPDRHCVVGGMHRWPVAFARSFTRRGGRLALGTRVTAIHRRRGGVTVHAIDQNGWPRAFAVEHVVCCQHATQTLRLLADATAPEQRALGRFRQQRARVVVHRDANAVADRPDRIGAFHYVVQQGPLPRVRPTITFHPNVLARLPSTAPHVYVTMNPHREPRLDAIDAEQAFLHPVAAETTAAAATAIERLQGTGNTWFAGSHLRPPFVHESALQSGYRAAELLLGTLRRRTHTPLGSSMSA